MKIHLWFFFSFLARFLGLVPFTFKLIPVLLFGIWYQCSAVPLLVFVSVLTKMQFQLVTISAKRSAKTKSLTCRRRDDFLLIQVFKFSSFMTITYFRFCFFFSQKCLTSYTILLCMKLCFFILKQCFSLILECYELKFAFVN